jgi:hypothetical protein
MAEIARLKLAQDCFVTCFNNADTAPSLARHTAMAPYLKLIGRWTMKRYLRLSIFLGVVAAAAALFGARYTDWVSTAALAGEGEAYLVVLDAPDGFAAKAGRLGFTKIEALNFSSLGASAHRVTVPGGARLEAELRRLRRAFPDAIIDQNDG